MRNTVQRLVEVSYHRSGRNPGFSALRPHKAAAPSAAPASTLVAAGPSARGSMPAPAQQAGCMPLAHADLAEQEAARRASAPPIVHGSRSASSAPANAQKLPDGQAGGGGRGVGAEGGDSIMADAGVARDDGANGAGAASGGPGRIVAGGAGEGQARDGGIQLTDVLYVLENEVCGMPRRPACALGSWLLGL